MKCTKCGAELKDGNIYCSECGEEMVIVPEYNVMEDASFQEYMKTLENGAEGEEEPEEVEEKNPGRMLGMWISICTAVFIVVFAGIVVAGMKGIFNVAATPLTPREVSYLSAMKFMANKDYASAVDAFSRMVAVVDEGDINPYIYQYEIYVKQGDKEGQKTALETILKNDPDNIPAVKHMIELIVEERDFDSFYRFLDEKKEVKLDYLFAEYIIPDPKFEIKSTDLQPGDEVEILMASDENVYYTMDGTDPKEEGKVYYIPISLPEGETTIRAIATNALGYYSREVSTTVYTDNIYDLAMPALYPESGEYNLVTYVKVDVPNGCTAYYTWDGTNPTVNSAKYETGIEMPVGNNVLSVMLVDEYGNVSPVKTGYYRYMPNYVEE